MLHQPCDLRPRDRYNRYNHNQFDLLCNRKRLQQARRRNNHCDQHRRVRDQRHRVRDQFRHHQVHHDRFRHRQLPVDQKVA